MADIQGWGRGTWSSGSWGEFIPVEVTGNQVNTSLPLPQEQPLPLKKEKFFSLQI